MSFTIRNLKEDLEDVGSNFDGAPDLVTVQSEQSLAALTNIQADFNGNGTLDQFDPGVAPTPLSGDELAIFHTDGQDIGSSTRNSTCHQRQPSISAASSSSFGMARNA